MSFYISGKKAEMSSKMIVSLVLLIAGFAILASAFFSFEWESENLRQVCHQSVVLRATSNQVSGMDFVPLNCKTQKKCVTTGLIGGKCESVFKNSNDVKKIKVNSKKEVEKFIADEIIDCWSMMGEGKLSIFSNSIAEKAGIGSVYPSCIVCSRIAFDEDLDSKYVRDLDVYDYMKKNKVPGKDFTYAEYFSDSQTKPAISSDSIEIDVPIEDEEGNIETEDVNIDIEPEEDESESQRPEELGIVFMQISAPSHGDTLKNLGKLVGAGATAGFLSPGGRFMGTAIKGACGGIVRGAICGSFALIGITAQQINTKNNRDVAAGYCTDSFKDSSEDARNGCSVVRVVDYTAEDLTEYCSVIESEV